MIDMEAEEPLLEELCVTVHIFLSPGPIQQCRCVEGRWVEHSQGSSSF